jgi:carbon-monoxide dehydrogenase large subunit
MSIARMIGAPVKRKEDPRMITGHGTYVDDVQLVGTAYMSVVRSPHAHARIRSIDTSAAKSAPGVLAVYTAEDVRSIGPIPVGAILPGMKDAHHGPLAEGKVRFVGDPVAVVIAEDRYAAEDAAELVKVDYEPLPAVVDMEKAMEPGAPLLYEEFGTNVALAIVPPGKEEIDEIFNKAEVKVGLRIVNQRLFPVSMETRGVVASYNPGDGSLTVWVANQAPHILRARLAQQLGMPDHKVRVIAPDVGGGFGAKIDPYPEEALCSFASMKLGRPVKWSEARSEGFTGTTHGRDQIDYVEVAATKEGRIQAIKLKMLSDLGAYLQYFTAAIAPAFTLPMVCGCYDIPKVYTEGYIVYTNKTPTDAYRGAGRPEAAYLVERIVDRLAVEIGKDPAEVRRLNFIKPDQFPKQVPTGLVYDSGNYEAALDKALKLANYESLRREQAEKRTRGELMGIGVSSYIEICGLGPKGTLPDGGYESARVRVERDGSVTVYTGSSPHGQGEETSFAQIVADGLGVPFDDVTVVHGDTANTPEGRGTYGSRTLAVGGSAVLRGVERIREKAKQIAAHMLEADVKDIVFEGGRFHVAGAPQKAVTIKEIAEAAYAPNTLPYDIEPGLEATAFFEPENSVFPFGTHIAVVDIDRDTGEVHLRKFVGVDDCGERMNPLLIEGQLHGGIVQGIGQALFEEVVYDENGQLLSNTLMDYPMPTAADFPRFELDYTITATPLNPLGVKGVGEAGTIGSTPAIGNAVADALAPLGIHHVDMPFKPERIWKLIHQQGS